MSIKPTCREVHRLTSEGQDRELSLVEHTRMQMHLLTCQPCRIFTEQTRLLHKAMQRLSGRGGNDKDESE
ncbi:zf-HC2 domain-containing protein [Noviherbaspirillum sp. CPCC 100848]|uniref:Zf-HC2 domain-containing protein n=1 Tax=Noviherbaspirillum album TaxID=3080276 RepID=A0ABU6JGT7_9BURK|nr:zf-HC2 domain-containing protein [Noviherbaspirillum sp. CPCC 100848]MEC4722628.1 zf-HC2 domain-containing protein [Noviherbaspirillum sp. CPCC 100848]